MPPQSSDLIEQVTPQSALGLTRECIPLRSEIRTFSMASQGRRKISQTHSNLEPAREKIVAARQDIGIDLHNSASSDFDDEQAPSSEKVRSYSNFIDEKMPLSGTYSPDNAAADVSFMSTTVDNAIPLHTQAIPHSMEVGLPPTCLFFATEAEKKISRLEKEIRALSNTIQLFPKNSQTWLLLQTYRERAREEMDAIPQDIEIQPPTKDVRA